VTEGQVQKAIAKAKKSSVDLNGVLPEMLKLSGENIIPQLAHVINMSIRESKVPGCWKRARVVPVFKKNSKTAKEIYRPVIILSVGSKIMEEIVREQLTKYLRKFGIIPQEQHGF
jgi:hypothetical protein